MKTTNRGKKCDTSRKIFYCIFQSTFVSPIALHKEMIKNTLYFLKKYLTCTHINIYLYISIENLSSFGSQRANTEYTTA